MELTKKNVQMLRRKNRAENQLSFDEDYNVPDHRPDVGRIIQKKGEILVQEVQVSEGKALVRGSFRFWVLYVSDTPNRSIASLEGSIPIEETLFFKEVSNGDRVCLKWEIDDLTIHLIHSRKMNIKAIVEFYGVVEEVENISLPTGILKQEEISTKMKNIRILTLGIHKKDTLRKKEEIAIISNKPNIRQILWKEIQVQGVEVRAGEGKVAVKGMMVVFVLFEGDDENNSVHWTEERIPFVEELPCSGSTMDMIPYLDAVVIQTNMEIKPDADGEERVFQAEAVLELDLKLYQEETNGILLDAYTPKVQCIPKRKNTILEQLLIKNDARCRVGERIQVMEGQNKILQLCYSTGKVKVDATNLVENGIQVEGIVPVRVLCSVSDDDMPFTAVETTIPFSHVIQAEKIGEDCKYQVQAEVEELHVTMLDGSEMEMKAVIHLDTLVVRQWEEPLIQEITQEPLNLEKMEQMPGIVCYIVQPEDSLWDIAKKFYTTVESIQEINGLQEEPSPSDALLVVKKVH